jgi:hypothetical protein
VFPHPVFEDRQHRVAPVGVEDVPGRQIDGVVVVEATPRGEPLGVVLPREGYNVGDLLPFRIYDP